MLKFKPLVDKILGPVTITVVLLLVMVITAVLVDIVVDWFLL